MKGHACPYTLKMDTGNCDWTTMNSPCDDHKSPCDVANKKGRHLSILITQFFWRNCRVIEDEKHLVSFPSYCFAKRNAWVYSWPRQLHPEDRKAEKSAYCLPVEFSMVSSWSGSLLWLIFRQKPMVITGYYLLQSCGSVSKTHLPGTSESPWNKYATTWSFEEPRFSECQVLYSRLSTNKLGNTFAVTPCIWNHLSNSEYPKPFVLCVILWKVFYYTLLKIFPPLVSD